MADKPKILIIEDEHLIARAYQEGLGERGYDVRLAFDGEEGLEQIKEDKPDIIILDLMMPRMDGHKFLEELKKEEGTAHIPVIVMTNLDEREHIVKTLEKVPTYYMVKANTDLKHLAKQVDAIMEHLRRK